MSLEANQIATKGDLQALFLQMQQLLSTAPKPAAPSDEYLTLDEVATATRTCVRTVKKWITEGKFDLQGKRIFLFKLEFSEGYMRVPKAALVAFGAAQGFTIADLQNPPQMRALAA